MLKVDISIVLEVVRGGGRGVNTQDRAMIRIAHGFWMTTFYAKVIS